MWKARPQPSLSHSNIRLDGSESTPPHSSHASSSSSEADMALAGAPAASGSPSGAGYLCAAGGCSRVRPAGLRWRDLLATAARWTAAPASTRAVLSLGRYGRAKHEEGLLVRAKEACQASGYHRDGPSTTGGETTTSRTCTDRTTPSSSCCRTRVGSRSCRRTTAARRTASEQGRRWDGRRGTWACA